MLSEHETERCAKDNCAAALFRRWSSDNDRRQDWSDGVLNVEDGSSVTATRSVKSLLILRDLARNWFLRIRPNDKEWIECEFAYGYFPSYSFVSRSDKLYNFCFFTCLSRLARLMTFNVESDTVGIAFITWLDVPDEGRLSRFEMERNERCKVRDWKFMLVLNDEKLLLKRRAPKLQTWKKQLSLKTTN